MTDKFKELAKSYVDRIITLESANFELRSKIFELEIELEQEQTKNENLIHKSYDICKEISELKFKYAHQRPMYYEDRETLLVKLSELIDDKLVNVFGHAQEKIDSALWTDELYNKLDEIFEPYTNGMYRNYN